MRTWPYPLLALLVAANAAASGLEEEADARVQPLSYSPDFMEPTARTRFHLTTRMMPGDTAQLWTMEAGGVIRVVEGAGVTFGVGTGWDRAGATAEPARDDAFFVGNVRVGFAGGHLFRLVDEWDDVVAPELVIGGALDIYIPTRPRFDGENICPFTGTLCDPAGIVGTTRPLEPGMYLAGAMALRARGHVGFEMRYLGASAEVGLTPAFTLETTTRIYMWLTWAVRVRGIFWDMVEPYVEVGGAVRTVEPAAARFPTGPIYVTPGVRVHLGLISPAIFASFRVSDDSNLGDFMFGLDIGGAATRFTSHRARTNDDMLEF